MRRLLIISVFLLSSCMRPMQPRMGMTFNELNRQAGNCSLEMVAGEGDMAIYHVRAPISPRPGEFRFDRDCNPNIFYYFQDDKLVKIDQGQLYQQRYRIDINR